MWEIASNIVAWLVGAAVLLLVLWMCVMIGGGVIYATIEGCAKGMDFLSRDLKKYHASQEGWKAPNEQK